MLVLNWKSETTNAIRYDDMIGVSANEVVVVPLLLKHNFYKLVYFNFGKLLAGAQIRLALGLLHDTLNNLLLTLRFWFPAYLI